MTDKSLLMNHTSLRIKDPKVSLPFYEKNFGLTLINHFIMDGVTLYLLGHETGEKKNWAARSGLLELCHGHGSENDPNFKLNNGNGEKFRGFGHFCVSVDNIAAAEEQLIANGVNFKKKLSDGRQKDIAFALDPDGYWIELVEHNNGYQQGITEKSTYKLNHTMVRVKDPEKSLKFYRDVMGMKLFAKQDHEEAQFSLYFLGYDHNSSFEEGKVDYLDQRGRDGILELTHNWGTENDDSFEGYHDGNSTENGATPGYGHICVSSAKAGEFCENIDKKFGNSIEWAVKWDQGPAKGLAFIKDPDGYSIEIFGHDLFHDWVDGRPPK